MRGPFIPPLLGLLAVALCILLRGSSLSSWFNFQSPKMVFRGSLFVTGRGGGTDEDAEGAGGGKGPGGACAWANAADNDPTAPISMRFFRYRMFDVPSCRLVPQCPILTFPAKAQQVPEEVYASRADVIRVAGQRLLATNRYNSQPLRSRALSSSFSAPSSRKDFARWR